MTLHPDPVFDRLLGGPGAADRRLSRRPRVAAVRDDRELAGVVWCAPEGTTVTRPTTGVLTRHLPPGTSVDAAMAWIAALAPRADEEVRQPWGHPWCGW